MWGSIKTLPEVIAREPRFFAVQSIWVEWPRGGLKHLYCCTQSNLQPCVCSVPGDGACAKFSTSFTLQHAPKNTEVKESAKRQQWQSNREPEVTTYRIVARACLYLVAAVEDVDHALRVRVPLVAGVRGPVVDHGLIDGVGGLVGEDARRQARHQLHDLEDPAALHDVVVDEDVLAEELHLVLEVAEQAPHLIRWVGKRAVCGSAGS